MTSLLDQIDPNLRDVVETLRADPTSLLYRGGEGAFPLSFDAAELRPMSAEASERKAEEHLLRYFRDELAVWLLRGVFVEWQRLNPLGLVYRCEETQPGRLRWGREHLLASAGRMRAEAQSLSDLQPAGGDPAPALDALSTLSAGTGAPTDLLTACALSKRLSPHPEANLFAAQLELGMGHYSSAMGLLNDVDDRQVSTKLRLSKHSWLGTVGLHVGDLSLARAGFGRARGLSGSDDWLSIQAGLLITGLVASDMGEVERVVDLLEAQGSREDHGRLSWVSKLMAHSGHRLPGCLYSLAQSRAHSSLSTHFKWRLEDE